MKIAMYNNERTLTLTRNEMLELARRHNAKALNADDMYDIGEIEQNFPYELTILESGVGITDQGFIIFKEDFEEMIKG